MTCGPFHIEYVYLYMSYMPNKSHGQLHLCAFVVCNVEGNVQNAVLEYSHGTDGHVRLLSTEVPESFRGKGVAASLAKVQ